MKISNIEKIVIGIIIACLFVMFFSMRSCSKIISDNGGIESVMVQCGKDIKNIKKQIDED